MTDQREQITALERVAAGHHQRWPAGKARRLINQRTRLFRSQLTGIGRFMRRGPAVFADQIASLRDLVIEHQRAAIELLGRIGCGIHGF